MSPGNYRRRLIEAVIARLLPLTAVRACFEGGSAATGRLDDYSDIDIMIVASLDRADAVFAEIESALSPHTITHVWPIEPPPFPETAQRVYFLADAPSCCAVDCVVVTEAGVAPFLERERHGEPLVYFDRTSRIRARPADQAALADLRARRWRQLQGAVPVYGMLVDKELARGRPLEAFGYYQTLLRALIEVLGITHRPDRFDFGWRYLESQLPADARALIAAFAFVGDERALREQAPRLVAELQRRLHAGAPTQ